MFTDRVVLTYDARGEKFPHGEESRHFGTESGSARVKRAFSSATFTLAGLYFHSLICTAHSCSCQLKLVSSATCCAKREAPAS